MTTISVVLHENKSYTIEVESFVAEEVANKLNDHSLLMVSIGDLVVNKNSIKLITPLTATEETV